MALCRLPMSVPSLDGKELVGQGLRMAAKQVSTPSRESVRAVGKCAACESRPLPQNGLSIAISRKFRIRASGVGISIVGILVSAYLASGGGGSKVGYIAILAISVIEILGPYRRR